EINEGGKGIFTPNQLHHPDETIIGKNKANPIGLISSAALMLKYSFGLEEESQLIENAIDEVIE
ncbi:isocitrate/isopropylmalate family dehydrogenase, partial [Terrisporobacter hibernicus]